MAGQNELMAWLQSVMPNAGAQQPYDPRQNPSLTPTAGVPGGGLLGYSAATPGQPSMGYPALGQPGAAPQPQQAGGGVLDWLRRFGGAIGDAGATGGDPYALTSPQPPPMPFGGAAGGGGDPRLLASVTSAKPAGGIGDYPDSTNYPHAMTPPRFDWPASSTPTGMPSPTPEGSPSATPAVGADAPLPPKRPRAKGPLAGAGKDSERFTTFQYRAPNSVGDRAPIYTALNLNRG